LKDKPPSWAKITAYDCISSCIGYECYTSVNNDNRNKDVDDEKKEKKDKGIVD